MGHYSYLAIVISGIEPARFNDDIHNLSRKIHNQYYRPLRQFDGDITQFGEMPKLLKRFTRKYDAKPGIKKPQKSRPYLLYILIGLLLISLTLFAIKKIPGFITNWKTQNASRKTTEAIPNLSSHEMINHILQRMSQSADFQNIQPDFIVEDNHVTIEGKVPSIEIKRKLGYLVSEIARVKIVINNLEVNKNIELSIEEIRVFLRENMICFEADDAVIPEFEFGKLNTIIEYLAGCEDTLAIKGYSDNLADSAYNLNLSEQRAQSVADYLTARGFPASRIAIETYGEQFPIASNETEDGRAKNRRVEFDIIRKR